MFVIRNGRRPRRGMLGGMFLRTKADMITLDEALPGRTREMPVFGPAHRARHAPARAVAGRARGRVLRHGLLLGRRAALLADARRLLDRGRLPGWVHREPDVRGDLHRPDRAHRGRPGRLRPGQGVPTPTCSRCSGRTTTRPRACARATTSVRSTGRRSTRPPTAQLAEALASRDAFAARGQGGRPVRHHHRDRRRRGRSTTPRTTTSSTFQVRRTPTGTATTAPTA